MRAMVLAAGVGSRLDPLTSQIPKPLVPIVNRPVMEHTLNLLKRHGITDVVSNLHHLPDKLIQYFGDGSKLGLNLTFHFEATLSGDAGGVRACRQYLGNETFLVMMGDLLTDADITAIVAAHKAKKALATIAVKRVEDVSQFGVVLKNAEGFITGFQEKPAPQEALSDLASTGIYVLEPEVFQHIPEQGVFGFGRQLFPALVNSGEPVLGYEINSYWSDVGTIKQYRQSNFDALNGLINLELPGSKTSYGRVGDNSSIGEGCQIEGRLLVGNNSQVGRGVTIKGSVILGDGCNVSDRAQLEDAIIWSQVNIETGAKIQNAVIGHNCLINGSQQLQEATIVQS